MREIYELSDESRKVLSHNPQAIAVELGKHHSFVYDFLELRKTDLFAQFLPLFDASIRAGAPFCYWTNRLEDSIARYGRITKPKPTAECIKDLLGAHHKAMVQIYGSLEDGQWSDSEIAETQKRLDEIIEEAVRMRGTLGLKRK